MRIVVLTGAGISAESGLPTFRDANGLWEGHRPEEVATPEAYDADPDLVLRFYDTRRDALRTVEPNEAHTALAVLERDITGGDVVLVTQNIDDLHERAGSHNILHMHGELRSALCTACGSRIPWRGPLATRPRCGYCEERALRPDVVWFGETPYHLEAIDEVIARCDLFVAIGTSGVVYPAAGFVSAARAAGARTLELNLEPSAVTDLFDASRFGPATETVPLWVAEVLAG